MEHFWIIAILQIKVYIDKNGQILVKHKTYIQKISRKTICKYKIVIYCLTFYDHLCNIRIMNFQ